MGEADTGAVGLADDRDRHRTQIVVAVISATATVIAASVGIISKIADDGPSKTATPVAPKGTAPYDVSVAAHRLIDSELKECGKTPPEEAANEWVSISAPPAGADVGGVVKVEGTVRLAPGNHLYLFSYAPDLCDYFFNPPMPLRTENGRWTWSADVHESSGPGYLTAAVVDEQTATLFTEIIHAMQGREAPYVVRLPPTARAASVRVTVQPD